MPEIIKYTAEPPATRWTYVKTAIIIFVATEVMTVIAQFNLVEQKPDLKYSPIIAGVVSLVIVYLLSRSPLTRALAVDDAARAVVVEYATLTKASQTLSIPYDKLGVRTETTSAPGAEPPKWKTNLLLDGQSVYLLLSSETGFTAEQLNDFIAQAKARENQTNG